MTPEQFIAKWRSVELKERSAAQSHFLDLCELLEEPKPTDADPKGEWYCFERGATKTTGGEGWADVWKRGHFGWEYKGKRKSLDDALDQLKRYALALENPPLLVVSDLDRLRVVTNWTNTVSSRHDIALNDLRAPAARQKLRWAFSEPERLAAGPDAAGGDRDRRAQVRRPRPGPAGGPATTPRRSPTSSIGWCSACSRRMSAFCQTRCSSGCWTRRWPGPRASRGSAACSSRPCARAAWSASSPSPGSTAACSTATRPCP